MTQQAEDIKVIRKMMERSSKFQSISGLSLIIAGITAVSGVLFACFFILRSNFSQMQKTLILLADAFVVLLLATGIITFFSWREAKKNNITLFSRVTMRAAYNLMIPLAAGGIFSLILLYNGEIAYIVATTLIFYGLALINASKFTVGEIHLLGICEVITGIFSAIYIYYGIYWWILGFGFLHIIFGTVMLLKYNR
jgi:hypothetical protein